MITKKHSEYFSANITNMIEEILNNEAQRIHEELSSKYGDEFDQRMMIARKSAVINAARFFDITEHADNITINFKMDALNGKR